jgi:hypothetical protein
MGKTRVLLSCNQICCTTRTEIFSPLSTLHSDTPIYSKSSLLQICATDINLLLSSSNITTSDISVRTSKFTTKMPTIRIYQSCAIHLSSVPEIRGRRSLDNGQLWEADTCLIFPAQHEYRNKYANWSNYLITNSCALVHSHPGILQTTAVAQYISRKISNEW